MYSPLFTLLLRTLLNDFFLKPFRKYLLFLLLLNLLLFLAGYLFISLAEINISLYEIIILLSGFSLISLATVKIFMRGQTKDAESQTMHSLVSIGLKFLLEMVLALVWFVILKKTTLSFLIIFFVLYLSLTLFSVNYILKILKNKLL